MTFIIKQLVRCQWTFSCAPHQNSLVYISSILSDLNLQIPFGKS